ncbi:MAG: translocation/assembly module TamB domain-containing protein [Desulfosoma sp.]
MKILIDRIQQETGADVAVGGFRWSPFGSLRLKDVSVETNGTVVFSTDFVQLEYRLGWFKPHVSVHDVTLEKPFLRLERFEDGRWCIPLSPHRDDKGGDETPRRWPLWPSTQVAMIAGRIQGFQGERRVLDMSDITGKLRLHRWSEGDRSGVEVLFEPWRMELRTPISGTWTFAGKAFWENGTLRLDTLEATFNETSRVIIRGTWNTFPEGNLSAQIQLKSWQRPVKVLEQREKGQALGETTEGVIEIEGLWPRLQARYDLRQARGHLVGTGFGTFSKEAMLFKTDASVTGSKLPWGLKGSSDFSGKVQMVLEHKQGSQTKLSLSVSQGRYGSGNLLLQQIVLDMDLQGDLLTVRRAAARCENACAFETVGTVSFTKQTTSEKVVPTLDLSIKADQVPLVLLQDLLPNHSLMGFFSGNGKLQGTWPNLNWSGRMTARDVIIGSFRAKTVGIDGTSSLSILQGSRKLALEFSTLSYRRYAGDFLSLTLRQNGLSNTVDFEAQGKGLAGLERLSVQGRMESLQSPLKLFRIEKGDFSVAGERYGLQGEIRAGEGSVDISALRLSRETEEVQLQGILGTSQPLNLTLRAKNMNLAHWLPKVFSQQSFTLGEALKKTLQGRLEAQVSFRGALENPSMLFHGTLTQISVPGLEQVSTTFSGRYETGWLTFRGEFQSPFLNTPMLLEGSWPVELRLSPWICRLREGGEGQLRFAARNVALEKLNVLIPLEELKGLASFDGRLVGSVTNPRLEGSGTITGASFLWPGWKQKIHDLDIQWRAEGSSVHIENAEFTLLGSRGRAYGEVLFPGTRFAGYTLHVAADEVQFPEIFGIVGQGAVRGTISQAGYAFAPNIVGEVNLTRASISLGELEKDVARHIRLVEETSQGSKVLLGRPRGQVRKHEVFQSVGMQLQIHLPSKGTWVRGFGLEAEVQGGVTLHKVQNGPLQLLGTLGTSKGEYVFQGVRMKVVEGEVTFRGQTPPDPFLSLTCQKDLRDVSITASLTGQISRPTLVFSSTPEMDQVDIVSMLLYGRPAKDLNPRQTQDLRDRGVQFAWGGTTPVVKSLLSGMPLSPDAVDIKGTENGSVLEIGKYLTPELYVTYQKSLEGDKDDELRAEYRVNRYLSVESQVGREDRAGVDVFFRYDFGK